MNVLRATAELAISSALSHWRSGLRWQRPTAPAAVPLTAELYAVNGIHAGMSGSPVVDDAGRAVGVVCTAGGFDMPREGFPNANARPAPAAIRVVSAAVSAVPGELRSSRRFPAD
jgi:hypothetical protein